MEDNVEKVEEYLKRCAEARLLVVRDFATDYVSEVDDKTSQTSESSDVPQATNAAEAIKAEVASLKVKQEKKRLQEELKLQERAAQIKIQREKDKATHLKVEAKLLSQYGQSK